MTNRFVITDSGLYAASNATPTGPYIQIVSFKLGDDYLTPALQTDTQLVGNVVYSGVPSSFSYYDANTVQVNLEVPADIGPFDYGELGVYLPGDVLFARFSYGVLRTKQTSISSGFANVLRIKALLRLSQGPAVFDVHPGANQDVLELSNFQIVNTPVDHPENPLILAHEPNDFQESALLFRNESTLWNLANYTKIGTTIVSAAPDFTHITSGFFGTLYLPATGNLGKYLIQVEGGYLRTISSITGNTAQLASPIDTLGMIGENISVYQLNTSLFSDIVFALGNLDKGFPRGTRMAFQQSSAPPGWVKDTSPYINDAVIRLVTGNASNGGNRNFSAWNVQSFIDPAINYSGVNPANPFQATTGSLEHTHALQRDLKYLDFIIATKSSNVITPTNPVASFTWSPSTGSAPLNITFTDTTINNPTSWLWDFGDGATSTLQNPTHTFNGTSTVTLTVMPGGSSTSVSVTVVGQSPQANFSYTPTGGVAPTVIQFSDSSTAGVPTSWQWSFGDGATSTAQNPSHNYTTPGTFNITLIATNASGNTSVTKSLVITTSAVVPVANFVVSPSGGNAPLNSQFTDISTNFPTSWLWDFGDGGSSIQRNPLHTYTAVGNYTVKLTATNSAGSNTYTAFATIHVTSGGAVVIPAASFAASVASGPAPLSVTFTDTSTNTPTSWLWDFGDGSFSTQQNP